VIITGVLETEEDKITIFSYLILPKKIR
jgi:hypothetical protein